MKTSNRLKKILFLLVGGILCVIIGIALYTYKTPPLPIYEQIKDFRLTSSRGEIIERHKLFNKIVVFDFVFTTCSTICPIMTKNMSKLQGRFNQEQEIKFVSVSVNPEFDTPEVLNQYAKKYHADTEQWYFLTGRRDDIRKLVLESFKLGSVEEPIFHSPHFVLLDRETRIRGYYDGTDKTSVDQLALDLRKLLKEN